MTKAEEKAKELIGKFEDLVLIDHKYDEQPIYKLQIECALICVDEIINVDITIDEDVYLDHPNYTNFWRKVKTAIQNYKPT